MARRNGRKGDWLATDDYTGFTHYASELSRDYWGSYAKKPLLRNLQEIASPLNDPLPVPFYNGPTYETTPACVGSTAPLFVGNTNVRTSVDNAAGQAFNLFPAIPDMEVGCTFLVYPTVSYVESVQAFEITIPVDATSATITISSIDPTRSVIFLGGITTTNTGTTYRQILSRVEITNATTITAFRDSISATNTVTVRGTVVQFKASTVTSVQQSTVTIAASATSGTITISSVDTTRSALFLLGSTVSTTVTAPQSVFSRIDITNSTTITANRASSSTAAVTLGFAVVQFAAGVVQRVQSRSVTLANSATASTDTIESVNPNNSITLYNGVSSTSATINNYLYRLQLIDPNAVTITRTGTSTTSRTINYMVLEFVPGVIESIQRNSTAVSSATSADAAILNVNTARSVCNLLNFSSDANTSDERFSSARLLGDQTVRSEKNTAGITTSTTSWEIIEFA